MKSGVPAGIVAALGLTQIIGYGTLYYSFSILAPAMARDLGLTVEQVFGVFSASLLVGGLSAPLVGGWMDRFGAATIMTFGSAVSALALLLCAWSPSTAVFAIAIVLLEVASSMVQYQAAFAALVEIRPKAASRSITYLTLIGGFASTIFWPIAASLGEFLSWREIYIAYALLNLLVCLPLHRWIMRSRTPAAIESSGLNRDDHRRASRTGKAARHASCLVGLCLTGVHTFRDTDAYGPMLGAIGFGAAAVMIGSLFGPSQVLSRLINMTFGANLLPPMLAALSATLIVASVVVLGLSGTWLPGAVVFAICLGLGSGVNSIAQGSLPLWLFGSVGYGAITGRMAAARLAAGAMAPFVFSVLMERFGTDVALLANACLGAVGMGAFLAVALAAKRRPDALTL
ncbi:MFS transporter [Sinorhizobium meliloti]|uniref:arsenite efflux MFS transporter ArsK n=1 Tax=Rhizobium meliloti TaxID=382 RepID=UPI000FE0DC8D|nr:arsenite efflux MFS transporter ArsK [Sinorhizobium meliloti]RVG98373.1 MFS transporter [Sinorhizobium meliloti]RVH59755.1 MFS transporter [Sinorhizobium meliloti]